MAKITEKYEPEGTKAHGENAGFALPSVFVAIRVG